MLGNAPQKVHDTAEVGLVSPDGAHIALVMSGGREIWLMGTAGEDVHRFWSMTADDRAYTMCWSPDGQRLAWFRYHVDATDAYVFLETVGLKDKQATSILSKVVLRPQPAELVWLPDGRLLYTYPEPPPHQNDWNIWEVRLDLRTGKALGQPRRLTDWTSYTLASLTASADGKRVAFAKYAQQLDVSVGELEAGGARMKAIRRLTLDESNDRPHGWLPDDRTVFFTSDRNGKSEIFKQQIDDSTAEPLASGTGSIFVVQLSADQRWILYYTNADRRSGTSRAPGQVMRLPVSGGPAVEVLQPKGFTLLSCSQPMGGLCVIGETPENEKPMVVSEFDPVRGKGRELLRIEGDVAVGNLSPDGKHLAYAPHRSNRIRIVSISGKAESELTADAGLHITGVDWAVDGKGLYVGGLTETGSSLVYMDLKGGVHSLSRQSASVGTRGLPSSDGRRLAFVSGSIASNAWMLEGF
jgi:Tol biopolymer transport system component